MRGSISNDGFSEAFTQEEEDRPQAGLCTTGSRGGGGLEHWYLLYLRSFRDISRVRESQHTLEETEAIRPRNGTN